MTYAELYHAEVEAHLEDTQRDAINAAFVGFRHVRSLTWPPRADRMGRDETVVFVRHTVASAVPELPIVDQWTVEGRVI
jgi:hypothetical protein